MKARKVLSILLSLAMTLSLVNVTAFAENEDPSGVAEIGGGRYETLAEAVSAAQNGDTITLLKDVTLTSTLEIQKSITLDLNGKTLTKSLASASDKAPLIKALSGTAEIKNGAITYDISTYTGTAATSNANVINVGMNMSNGIYSGGDCDLTLNGVDVSVTFPKGKSLSMIYVESGKLNVISSNLSATNVSGNTATQYLIYTTAHASAKVNPYVSISGSATLDTNSSAGIHAIWLQGVNDTLAISGNDVTISADATWKPNSYTTSYAYAVNNQSGATCTIEGGKFLGKVWQTKGTIDVSGGYFGYAQGTSGQKNKITLAEGVEYLENTDSATMATYPYVVAVPVSYVAEIGNTKYETLAEAVAAVPADGTETTITMIADYEVPMDHADTSSGGYNVVNIAKDQNVILDLNGKTITGVIAYDAKNSAVITVSEYGTLTIRDTSADQTGTITHVKYDDGVRVGNWAAQNWQTDILFNHGGTLTVESGTIANTANGNICYAIDTSNNYRHNDATLTITGGTVTSQYCEAIRMRLDNPVYGEDSSRNVINVSGGTITGRGGIWAQVSSGTAPKGSLTITGGTITGGDWGTLTYYAGSGVSIDDFTASITGGKITGTVELPQENYISGGKFSLEPEAARIAEGYEAVANTDDDAASYPFVVTVATPAVAKIGNVKYETLEAAIEAAQAGDTVVLLQNITLDAGATMSGMTGYGIVITKSITLDGNGKTITSNAPRTIGIMGADDTVANYIDVTIKDLTVNNANGTGRGIHTYGNVKSLTLDNVVLNLTGTSGYIQPLTIVSPTSNVTTVTIIGGTISAAENADRGYAITTFAPVNMTITGTTVKGWACLNIKDASSPAVGSAGSTFTVTDSTFISRNGTPGTTNAFQMFSIEDDNVTIDVTGTTMTIHGGDNNQNLVCFSYKQANGKPIANYVTVTLGAGNTIAMSGDALVEKIGGNNYSPATWDNKLYIDNGVNFTYDGEPAALTDYIPATFTPAADNVALNYAALTMPEIYYCWPDNNGYSGVNCASFYEPFEGPDSVLMADERIDLLRDVTLDRNVTFTTVCSFGDSIAMSGGNFILNFGEYDITFGVYKIELPANVTMTTDKQLPLSVFSVASGYAVVETANGNGTYTYSVAPADVYTAAAAKATGTLLLGSTGGTFTFTITKNGTKLTKTAEYSAEKDNWELVYDPAYIELTNNASVSGSGISYKVKALKAGETTITFRNIADPTITASTVLTNKHQVVIAYNRGTDATGNKYLLEKGTLTITKITFDGVAYTGADLDTFLESHTLTVEGNATIDGLNVTPNATGNVYIHVTDKEDATVTARSGLLNFINAVAQIGNDYYATLAKAFDAAQNGDTITLISDITEYVIFDGTAPRATEFALTLELNGHTFTAPANENFALRVQYGVITIKDSVGTGAIRHGRNSAILVEHLAGDYPSKVIIESGTFTGKSTVVQTGYPGGTGANYKYYGGELEVLGGTFVTVADTNENYDANGNFRYTLNMLDMNASAYAGGIYSESSITVKGGTFNGFDPANNAAEGAGTNFVAEGYESVNNGNGTWTVREVVQNVAEVNGVGYPTLAEAIAAANELENATVTLLRDYDMEANEPGYGYTTSYVAEGETTPRNNMIELSGTGLTLDLGGYALTNLFNNTFKVTGDGVTIQNGTMELGQLYYGSYSAKKGVTLYATPTYGSYVVYVDGATEFTVNNLATFGGINVAGGSTAEINNLSFSGLSFYAVCSQEGSVVTLNGGSYNKSIAGAAKYLFWVEDGSTMNITGGTFTKGTTNFITGVNPVITGGIFDFDPSNNGVAEGYEAAAIGEGLYQVGKLQVSDVTEAAEITEGYDATYTITKQVVSTDGEDNVLAENNAITVNVKAITENTPASDTTIEKIDSTALQTIISQAIEASDTSATEIEVQIEVVRDEPALETTGATPTITYEVHPVVKAFVGEELIGTEQIGNDSLAENASFTITLPVPDVLVNANGQVKVSHISEDYGTEVNVYDVVGEAGNYTVTFTVTHFSSFELAVAEIDGTGHADLGASLFLTDNIEINLYISNLKDVNGVKESDPSRFTVAYTFNGVTTEKALTSADSNQIVVATCAAKEIGDIVTIELYYDGTLVRQLEYSARMYCEGQIENSSDEKLVELCYALLDYGAYAQLRFDYKTQELANETYTKGAVESVSIPGSYAAEVSGATYIVNNIGASLSLESKTEINVYFISNDGSTAASGNYAVYVNDTRMTISDTEEGMICVNIPGIVAKDLGEPIEIIIDKAGEKMTVSYSPLSYAYRNQSSTLEGDVVKALYKYYLAAASYFEGK